MVENIQYKKPPIVERILAVYHQIPQEEFEKRLPSWTEKIAATYPVPGHLSEWMIDIEDRDGVPFVKSLVPKARIIHLFWKRHPKNQHVFGMRLRPDRLVFHLLREADDPHKFEELLPEMQEWLPRWAQHFGVERVEGVTVEYVNVLDGNITPQFLDQAGDLKIGEALTLFEHFPGKYEGFSAPIDSRIRLVIDHRKPIYFDVRVRGDERSRNAIRVDFNARIFPKAGPMALNQAIEELTLGHQVMLEQFACFFTKGAKASFAR